MSDPVRLFKNEVKEFEGDKLRITLTKGKSTVVNDTTGIREVLTRQHFYCMMNRKHGLPYAATKIGAQTVLLHHFIIPKVDGKDVDHINRDSLDNRLVNLRSVSKSINHINSQMQRNNTTGITGLYREMKYSRWLVKWSLPNKEYRAKYFTDKKYGSIRAAREAAEVFLYDKKREMDNYTEALKYFYETNCYFGV